MNNCMSVFNLYSRIRNLKKLVNGKERAKQVLDNLAEGGNGILTGKPQSSI